MKKISYLLIIFVSVLALMVASADARGGRGSGGRVGGGYSKPTFSGQRQFRGQSGTYRQFRGQTGVSRPTYFRRYNNVFNRNWWGPATWIALSSWVVWNWGPPLYYDYGSNFYYADDYVYLNGKRLSSAAEYYDQAVQIIDKAPEVTNDKDQWMPLGVFSVTQKGNKPSNKILQLAVNKEGVIQGTYFNIEDNTARPIKGMVDKESQRAVWTFADNNKNAMIMETGISNLTKDKTGVLVHFNKERTQTWLMVRLKGPSDKEKQEVPNTAQ